MVKWFAVIRSSPRHPIDNGVVPSSRDERDWIVGFRVGSGVRFKTSRDEDSRSSTAICLRPSRLFLQRNRGQFCPWSVAPRAYEVVSWRADIAERIPFRHRPEGASFCRVLVSDLCRLSERSLLSGSLLPPSQEPRPCLRSWRLWLFQHPTPLLHRAYEQATARSARLSPIASIRRFFLLPTFTLTCRSVPASSCRRWIASRSSSVPLTCSLQSRCSSLRTSALLTSPVPSSGRQSQASIFLRLRSGPTMDPSPIPRRFFCDAGVNGAYDLPAPLLARRLAALAMDSLPRARARRPPPGKV